MNKMITIPVFLMLTTALFAAEALAQKGRTRSQQGNRQHEISAADQQTTGIALTDTERQGLILMREEEKLARDVYLAMQEKWGAGLFANISRAETQHMAAMANLLSRYGIPDPVTNNTPGSFTAVRFQQLYQTLVASGSNSFVDALKVGLRIEEMDITDLRLAIQATSNQDIKRVYEQLERGSRNHLRAFAKQLNQTGGSYVPQILSQTDFDQIAAGGQERGGRQGVTGGRGMGQRQRNGRDNAPGNKRNNDQGHGTMGR